MARNLNEQLREEQRKRGPTAFKQQQNFAKIRLRNFMLNIKSNPQN
jgi:hypothetical protein